MNHLLFVRFCIVSAHLGFLASALTEPNHRPLSRQASFSSRCAAFGVGGGYGTEIFEEPTLPRRQHPDRPVL
ncbi:hypothetical protein N657DRAFT_644301 [Parathielavia appendiculata]|uniref:Secreted protein n=1 Tax=Parathielavia appendiculata TaxID=2587402 RepID=A0AAN6Z4R1_9PEZI|nr:hypothetical protein N657DRAFT_644301 [Parathielavia appendiculata]